MPSSLTGRPGEDVEAVVSIMICRRNERAARRRPGQGDRGIDVYVPTEDGRIDVYQVKRHDQPLTTSQWKKVKNSYDTLAQACTEGRFSVRNWYLTLPLNQSESDEAKFVDLTAGSVFESCEWRGLTWLDALASEYPEVVDYYLKDGKARLDKMHHDLMLVLEGRGAASTTADTKATTDGLAALHRSLNQHDPLYRYDFAVGDPSTWDIFLPRDPPGCLVLTAQFNHGDVCVTWYVYARCDESLRERPIPVTLHFDTENSPELRESLRLFTEYGKHFQAPAGTVAIGMDLPGGLGGSHERGTASISPIAEDSAHTYALRLRTQTATPAIASTSVLLAMNKPTVGSRGARLSGEHNTGVFLFEGLLDFEPPTMHLQFSALGLTGKPVSSVIDGLEFLYALPGKTLEVAAEYGPFSTFGNETAPARDDNGLEPDELDAIRALHAIQQYTITTLFVPDFTGVTYGDVKEWQIVAKILDGETVTDSRLGTMKTDLQQPPETPLDGDNTMMFTTILQIKIGEQVVDLGRQILNIAAARIRSDPGQSTRLTVTPLPGTSWTRSGTGTG